MVIQKKIHALNFCRKLTVNTLFFLVPLHLLKIGLSGWQIGVVVSLYGLAPLIFSFPIGWINDRLSIRRIIQAALSGLTLLFFLLALTKNFYSLAIIFLFLGIANNALDVSTNSLYYKDETKVDLNKKYGTFAFWLALGTATGTLSGGTVVYFSDFRILFCVYAGFLLIVLIFVKDVGRERFSVVTLKEYRLNLVNKKTILFSILIFILALHWGAEGTVYSPFLKSYFQLNDLQLSLYISISLFFLAFAALAVAVLRFNARLNPRIFLIALFLSGTGNIFMVNKNVYVSIFFRIIHEVGDGFLGALIFLFISRLFQKESIGGSSGILLALMTLGHMVGALIFSSLGYSVGIQYPFIVSGFLLIANSCFGFFVFRKIPY
jgi:DHA1 family quinolone resistance protein-like MFS transporter